MLQAAWIVGLALLAVMVGRSLWLRRRRIRQLQQLASELRLNYAAVDLIGLHDRYQNLELIRTGHRRHIYHVLYGSSQAGLVALFRYSYDVGFGAHRRVQQHWVAVLEMSDLVSHTFMHSEAAPSLPSVGLPHQRIGAWDVAADRHAVLDALAASPVRETLADLPTDCRIETRGHMIAAAVPAGPSLSLTPADLLQLVQNLARHLPRRGQ